MDDTELPDEADDSPTTRGRSRPWLPMALALVVVLAISVTSWALVSSSQSAERAEQAALTAEQVSRDSAAATATRVASEKAAADKAAAAAREKATVAAAVKKALADKERADEKKQTSAPRVIVRGRSDYSGEAFGTFGLTALARPGPIHVYESPTDKSEKLYPVYAYQRVTVYCSIRAQSINGHNYWDWTGDGWIWDKMVEINGHSPPPCGD